MLCVCGRSPALDNQLGHHGNLGHGFYNVFVLPREYSESSFLFSAIFSISAAIAASRLAFFVELSRSTAGNLMCGAETAACVSFLLHIFRNAMIESFCSIVSSCDFPAVLLRIRLSVAIMTVPSRRFVSKCALSVPLLRDTSQPRLLLSC